jgi:hypothetical protein
MVGALGGWLNPKPMSADQCRSLRDQIYRKNQLLRDEIKAYDRVVDGLGGSPMAYGSG